MTVLRQPVVFAMSTDSIPNEAAALKFANGTIMDAYAHTPFAATDLFKVQRRMKWFFAPKLIIFSSKIAGLWRQVTVQLPEFWRRAVGNVTLRLLQECVLPE